MVLFIDLKTEYVQKEQYRRIQEEKDKYRKTDIETFLYIVKAKIYIQKYTEI